MSSPLIKVENLTLQFKTDEGLITAVDNVSFEVAPGEIMGLVGESGSGKSVTAKSLMQLNPGNAVYSPESRITLTTDGESVEVLKLKTDRDLKVVRGGAVSMIFQEPMASFAPAITIGDQMVEQLLLHTDMNKERARDHSIEMLERVGISDAATRFGQYAFEFSGGMRQRAMVALSLSCQPKLLIADEPTTAVDVTIQAQMLELLRDIQADLGMAIIMITHDLGVIAELTDRVMIMYLGKEVEHGTVEDVFHRPQHPYTRGLLASIPKMEPGRVKIEPIEGSVPNPYTMPTGCKFHPRCADYIAGVCEKRDPPLTEIASGHEVSCYLYGGRESLA
jgi:peptide/nickel transport system ATP-binding protein